MPRYTCCLLGPKGELMVRYEFDAQDDEHALETADNFQRNHEMPHNSYELREGDLLVAKVYV